MRASHNPDGDSPLSSDDVTSASHPAGDFIDFEDARSGVHLSIGSVHKDIEELSGLFLFLLERLQSSDGKRSKGASYAG